VREGSPEWDEVIKSLPQKNDQPYFHTTDFVSGNDIYEDKWKGRYLEKLELLRSLARVIYHFAYKTITCVLDTDDYVAMDRVIKWSEAVGHPYAFACRTAHDQIQYWRRRNSVPSTVKMVIENRNGTGEVMDLFIP
jgi:hypothetical protein